MSPASPRRPPTTRRRRSSSSTPRSAARGRTTSATPPCDGDRRGRLRPAHHAGRQPRCARLLRSDPGCERRLPARHRRRGRRPEGRPQRHRQRPPALHRRAHPAHRPAEPYGDVAEDGTYSSPIDSPGRRFFTMLGTLVQGRVSLDGSAVNAAKIAPRRSRSPTATERRQFTAGSDSDEEVLLDYQRHQRRLLPLLATTYAASFAHEVFLHKFDDVFSGRTDTDTDRQDLETIAAALKPLSHLARARHPAGGARGVRRRRLPHREPAHLPARTTSTSTSPSRATTTCCCSSSRSAC